MNVVFRSKSTSQNRFTITDSQFGKLFFDKGVFRTSDKDMIKKLLNHPLKKRGEIVLETNAELVGKYLEGEEPDKLTREVLDTVSRQGIIELGKVLVSSETHPALIKEEIIGQPITEEVQEIVDFYLVKKEPEKEKAEVIEPQPEQPKTETKTETPKKKPGRPPKKK